MNLSIRHIEHTTDDGCLLTIHWKAEEGSESILGSTHLGAPSGTMIPYAEVTEAMAMGWLTASLDVAGITAKLQTPKAPKQGSGLPWVVTANAYAAAVARLAKCLVADGQAELTEMLPTGEQTFNEETMEMDDVLESVVTKQFIEAVEPTVEVTTYGDDLESEPTVTTITNPLITTDVAERETAQAVVAATPQAVKDA